MIFYKNRNTIKSLIIAYVILFCTVLYAFKGVTGFDGMLNYLTLFGISFVVLWTYSFVNYLYENKFDFKVVKQVSVVFFSIMLVIYFVGGLRISYSKVNCTPTIKIASISVSHYKLWNDIHKVVKEKIKMLMILGVNLMNFINSYLSLQKEKQRAEQR